MRITFQHPEDGWREFTGREYLCLYQTAHQVFSMFANPKITVIMEHDGKAVCSKALLSEVKRKYAKCCSFSAMLSKVKEDGIPLWKSMVIDMNDARFEL